MIDGSGAAANSQTHAQWRTRSRAGVGFGWERVGRAKLAALIDLSAMIAATTIYGLSTSSERVLAAGYVVAFVALVFALLALNGIYRQRMANSTLNEFRTIIVATGLAAAILTFATLLTDGVPIAHQAVRLWVISATFLITGRGALRTVEVTRWRRGKGGHATLILGAGKVGHLIARRLLDKPEIGLRPVGFIDDTPMEASGDAHVPILGPESELESVVIANGIEHAILSFSAAPHERTLAAARRLDELGVTVSLVPRLFEGIPDRTVLDRVAGIPVISVYPTDPRGWQLSIKYWADRVIAVLALVVLSPLLVLGAIAVRLDLGRPILFRQRRVGIDGQEFEMLKFRTMRGDPDNNGQANSDWADAVIAGEKGLRARPAEAPQRTSRATKVGRILRKTAIDELPQLLNVAKGEMSLIGPRPEMPQYANQFEQIVHRYGDRHRVKSGITGWAQVHGLRGRTSLSDRVEWDNYYIENWSPWLDLKIALMTVVTIIRDPSE